QPFSIIGDRGAMSDDRGTLIYEIVRILRAKQPKAFVLENVRQLSTIGGGAVMERILASLSGAGYACDWSIMNALHHGLPQKRERTIIVGFLRSSNLGFFRWPERKKKYKPLSEILEANPHPRYFVSERIKNKRHAEHTATVTPSIWHENKAGNVSSHPFSCALRAGASYNYLLVNGERRLTPREQLRLQGFPERFDVIGNDSQIKKQTGNAVPVPMVRAAIRSVLHAASEDARRNVQARAASA
ncbi:MAG: DNA (cytosine-5-)-methyltransferase, partial [Rhodobacteraceae bacterium]|nr:DNA (cytosine-5-)-methyltransferase [Paracoccaceae bacterium]